MITIRTDEAGSWVIGRRGEVLSGPHPNRDEAEAELIDALFRMNSETRWAAREALRC